jgi:ABC-2 type transport system permease protein
VTPSEHGAAASGPTRHFLWFAAVSLRNRTRLQIRRLRSPRYAIAALVGLLYFTFIFGDWVVEHDPADTPVADIYFEAAARAGPFLIALLAAWWWLWGGHRFGLVLSPAETQFLVPAPLSRPAIVRFKVLQAQATIAMSAALGTLLTRGAALPWPLRLISLWTLLATLHQHQIAASLVHAAAADRGRNGLARVWPALVLFAGAAAVVAWSTWQAIADIRVHGLNTAAGRFVGLMDEPAVRYALAPFRLVLEPLLATTASAWLAAMGPALVVLLLHYVWLQRTDAGFEEAAAAEGAARDARGAALQAGGFSRAAYERSSGGGIGRPVLPLRPLGWPGYAILWKNVLYIQRLIRPLAVLLLLMVAGFMAAPALAAADGAGQAARNSGITMLVLAGVVTLGGPFAVRCDLRLDLASFQALRVLPLPARDVVAAGIGATTLVVALLQILLASVGAVLLAAGGTLTPAQGGLAILAAPVLLPPLAALGVCLQNALVLLYPGWVGAGGQQAGGVETVGQGIITLMGSLLLMGLALIPAALAAGAVGALFWPLGTVAAGAAGALAGVLVVAGEVGLLVVWLGGLYDRLDPVLAGLLE